MQRHHYKRRVFTEYQSEFGRLMDPISIEEKKSESWPENAPKIEELMKNGNFAEAIERLKSDLQNAATVRLLSLIRLAICSLHVGNKKEVESSVNQIVELLKNEDVSKQQFLTCEKECISLLCFIKNKGFIFQSIEVILAWLQVYKEIADVEMRANKTTTILCLACDSIDCILFTLKTKEEQENVLLRHIKQVVLPYITQIEEFLTSMKEGDSSKINKNIQYVERALSTTKRKVDGKNKLVLEEEIKGCWTDLEFVKVCLNQDPWTKKFMMEEEFSDSVCRISKHPDILEEEKKKA